MNDATLANRPLPPPGTRVVVGVSGGVDSSVAALLLARHGLEVHGLYMFNWDEDEQGYCTAAEDYQDARRVCEHLGIVLHRVRFAAHYRERVFAHFLAEHRAGRTPNPDVLCNREIKFGVFAEHARRLGAEYIATGHYARVAPSDSGHRLLKGVDENKDQSYFLHAVDEGALARTVFPLGDLRKEQVRRLAQEAGLHNCRKRDSTGICFIGERPFREFLGRYLPPSPGAMCTPQGTVVGEHQGLMYYTLGQRQGLHIGGRADAGGEPWYVVAKRAEDNVLVVAQGHDHPLLFSDWLEAGDVHWINAAPPPRLRCAARVRYRQRDAACLLSRSEDGRWRLRFERPQRAVTPGQYAVIYDGDHCLGGGVIVTTGRDDAGVPGRARARPLAV